MKIILTESQYKRLSEDNLYIRRRLPRIKTILIALLADMYPCDYNSKDSFLYGVYEEIARGDFEVDGLSSDELADFINSNFHQYIEQFYDDANCD